jgi:hypothetical protein
MTGDQARRLKVGDKVCWTASSNPGQGVVMAVSRFGVTLEWSDGRATELFFNGMGRVNMAPANV